MGSFVSLYTSDIPTLSSTLYFQHTHSIDQQRIQPTAVISAAMAALDMITAQLSTYANNFTYQVQSSFNRLSVENGIRLVAIVGAYALLRPYLLKLGARFQAQDHEREIDPDEIAANAKLSANSLRGHVHVPDDTDSESEDDGKKNTDWGKKSRRRQRRVIRQLLDEEERMRKENEEADSDKEIEEFLVG